VDVNTVLGIGQMIVAIALIASILLQSRGAGLGAAFGGDSSVYRSRRGIEKRLFQFTVALGALFVLFSVANYAFRTTV
jgi:preprotein translocase subunit SecG